MTESDYLDLAFMASAKSPDPHTRHGWVLVGSSGRVLSQACNSSLRGLDPDVASWNRPEKYLWVLHAEENAIIKAERSLKGATAYVTGKPCLSCLKNLVQAGITTIVYGPIEGHTTLSEAELEVYGKITGSMKIAVRRASSGL